MVRWSGVAEGSGGFELGRQEIGGAGSEVRLGQVLEEQECYNEYGL